VGKQARAFFIQAALDQVGGYSFDGQWAQAQNLTA
jgi:hypothetical protein